MNKRPIILTAISWVAIVLGLFSLLASGGYLAAIYINQGSVNLDIEIRVVAQLVLSFLTILCGVGLLKRSQNARKALNIIYGLVLLSIPWLVANDTVLESIGPDQKVSYLLSYLVLIIPLVVSLYYLHTKKIREYLSV